jgi:hypothetical protein
MSTPALGQITVTGFFSTGLTNLGAAMTQGTYDNSAWDVVGSKVNGTIDVSDNKADYLGAAYEVGTSYLPSAWVTAPSSAAWITTHKNTGGNPNVLGSGTSFASGNQAAAYVYELSFTISGGSGTSLINMDKCSRYECQNSNLC